MAKQKKFYVIWIGRQTGVFETWDECSRHTSGFHGAVFKSFPSRTLAEQAFSSESKEFIGKDTVTKPIVSDERKQIIGNPILDSISVDGAWNTTTGVVEYKGVYTKTGEVIFEVGPYDDGTNNIVEFLGIVHALAHCKKQNITLPIYSDSKTAISWVKRKSANTKHIRSDRNEKLFILLERAVKWLKENEYTNSILKWETDVWGENPADFGRK
jgi:ribonuclease HI